MSGSGDEPPPSTGSGATAPASLFGSGGSGSGSGAGSGDEPPPVLGSSSTAPPPTRPKSLPLSSSSLVSLPPLLPLLPPPKPGPMRDISGHLRARSRSSLCSRQPLGVRCSWVFDVALRCAVLLVDNDLTPAVARFSSEPLRLGDRPRLLAVRRDVATALQLDAPLI